MATTPDDVAAGRIVGCFGIHGELKCVTSRAARALFVPDTLVRYELPNENGELKVLSVRPHAAHLLLTVEGVGSRDAAAPLVGATLMVERDSIVLEPGEYLDADLVGCTVLGTNGRSYGCVERIEHMPANDVLVLSGGMVPMVSAIVKAIDLPRRCITIDPPEGLLT